MDTVIDFIRTSRDRYVAELTEYLAIPSISALPDHADDVARCARWTADELGRVGLENVRLIETPGNPVVYADWLGARGAPTILFYGHYDVQPVDPLDEWESPPFEATVREGEIYARGAVDDKGQIFMHFKAVEACLKQTGRLPVNMKVILEGEEEIGSTHFDGLIRDRRAELAADVVVISDSPMFDRDVPSICYGLRGLAYFQIDLRGTASDLHSGSFGGAVANPGFVLRPDAESDEGPGPGGSRFQASTTTCVRWVTKSGRRLLGCRSTSGSIEPIWGRRSCSASATTDARAGVDAPHLRGQRPAVGVHRRWRQDRDTGGRDGEGQHASRTGPGPGHHRWAIRGFCAAGDAEDGDSGGHAAARGQGRG